MKKYLLSALLTGCAFLATGTAFGQQISKLILPDGKEITPDKLDSVKNAWHNVAIQFRHDAEDDKKHVMRLVPMTPEMELELQDLADKREKVMQAMIGRPAPDFTLTDLKGKKWSLSALKGSIVVLNFWFTSCPPCNREMPELNKLVDRYKGKNVVFLALTFNDASEVNEFLKTHSFTYGMLPLSKNVDKEYHISSWPTSFVIDKTGNIISAVNYSEHIGEVLSKAIDSNI